MDEDGLPDLFPELPPPGRRWEVTLTLLRPDWGGPLAPVAPMVADVIAMYSADLAQAVTEVTAADEGEAVARGRARCSGLGWAERATAEARLLAGHGPVG